MHCLPRPTRSPVDPPPCRRSRRRGSGFLPVILALVACSADSSPSDAGRDDVVASVEVSAPSTSLAEIGATVQLSARARNEANVLITSQATNFYWSSSEPAVVSVDAQGRATALAEGTSSITARFEGRSGSLELVVDLAVAEVHVAPEADTIRTLGSSRQLAAAARTAGGATVSDDPAAFQWSSSAPDVVAVDDDGRATALATGSATITASLEGVSGAALLVVATVAPGEFVDPLLEGAIRGALNQPSGPLTEEDLAGVVELDLSSRGIEVLTGIEHLVNLEVVNLRQNEVRDLAPLGQLPALREIDLSINQVSDVSGIAGAVSIEVLNLNGQVLSQGLSVLAGLPALRELRIVGTGLEDLTFLAGAPALEFLHAAATPELVSLEGLESVPTLFALFVTNSGVRSLEPLEGHPGLRWLLAQGNPVEDLAPLASLSELTVLRLGAAEATELSPLAGLVSLTELTLQEMEISDLSVLANLSTLERITVLSTQVSDLSPLEGLANLRFVFVPMNQIVDVAPLVANEALGEGSSIQLRENPLGSAALCQQIPALQARGTSVFFDGGC